MSEERESFGAQFILRGLLVLGMIYFMNQILQSYGISTAVGLNGISFLTSGILGIPGVALLYSVVFYKTL